MGPIRVYVGVSGDFDGNGRAAYVLTLNGENDCVFQTPPVFAGSGKTAVSKHNIYLKALVDALEKISEAKYRSEPVDIIYYCPEDSIAFEWNHEYKEDGKFSSRTEDQFLWNRVAVLVQNNKIKLTVAGNDSLLVGIDRIEDKRARRAKKGGEK